MTETNLPTLISQMLQPGFYPHPVIEPIELIQTHISYVLLTGDYAYKLKKPANFCFLDFSTLEKRKHFCEEELRLNQRGAGELYLEVIPLTLVGEQYHLGGTEEAVEYTVKMRQFPQECLFSELFGNGNLQENQLEELGRVVAQYHAQAETNDYIRSFGEVSQVRLAIDEIISKLKNILVDPKHKHSLRKQNNIQITSLSNIQNYLKPELRITIFANVMVIYTSEILLFGMRKLCCLIA